MGTSADEIRYQVFVSSTFTDLKEEREKVLQAILERKAFPAGMELFPSADEEQFEFIKREIDSSDYYIVIIAGRYGSVAEDGVSYTEKEYDYAVSIGKPVMTFLHKDIGKLIGDRLERGNEGQEKLQKFRQKAQARKLVSFYENPDDLKAKVFHSLVQQFDMKPMRGWVRAGQISRADLEKIADLQQQVITLGSENERLRILQNEAANVLANGDQTVTWHVDLSDLARERRIDTIPAFDVSGTWDEMLLAMFPGGTSYVAVDEVRRQILQWIVDKRREQAGDERWNEATTIYQVGSWIPNFGAVNAICVDLHRQFTGLGIIGETREIEYRANSVGGGTTPISVTVWRLTPRGEQHLAIRRGFTRVASLS